ncbi:MAG TPA: arginase family protein [Acidimicrobiia bacterium]|nr:arginase family protein [Acidimicrobiia bacterium]
MPIHDPLWPRADSWLAGGAADPDLVVVGVPSSSASLSPSEAWRFPAEFRAALGRLAVFDGETGADLRTVSVSDLGDWPVDGLDMHTMPGEVVAAARALDPQPVKAFLGGDNAITRPLVNGLSRGDLSAVGILTIDAHHDVRVTTGGPSNGSPIRGLIEDGLPPGRVVQVGIHSFANSAEYRQYCTEHGIEVVTMTTVDEVGAGWVVTSALADLARRCEWIYVDVDIDVLDLAFAPGCPGARPGGMTPRQLAAACRAAGTHPAVRAVDFVEVDPTRDRDGLTVMNAATAFLAFVSGLAMREAA